MIEYKTTLNGYWRKAVDASLLERVGWVKLMTTSVAVELTGESGFYADAIALVPTTAPRIRLRFWSIRLAMMDDLFGRNPSGRVSFYPFTRESRGEILAGISNIKAAQVYWRGVPL